MAERGAAGRWSTATPSGWPWWRPRFRRRLPGRGAARRPGRSRQLLCRGRSCRRALRRLHGLINAAGLTDRGTIDDTSPELFDRIFAVDARAPFFLIQRVLPWLRRAGGGTIVNVISITVHGGTPHLAYVGAKGALAATRNIAAAVGRDRVWVNGLNLGWTVTPGERVVQTQTHGWPPDWDQAVGASQPFGRLLTPIDAARAIAFLASDRSGLMTGALVDFEQQVMGAYPLAEP